MDEQTPARAVEFPEGWVGCPDWKRFTLERPAAIAPLALLNSSEIPELSLPAINPWMIKVDYAPQLTDADQAALGTERPEDLEWLVILNIQMDPLLITANLLGPVVINRRTGVGRQVVLSLSGYSALQPVGAFVSPTEDEVSHARADATA